MPRLSTHVLDTARGVPAAGLVIELYAEYRLVSTTVTNANGRTDEPLLSAEQFTPGVFELVFYAGDYFRASGVSLSDPPFLDRISVRFGIGESQGDYHVPLLLSPYSYSTYRGS